MPCHDTACWLSFGDGLSGTGASAQKDGQARHVPVAVARAQEEHGRRRATPGLQGAAGGRGRRAGGLPRARVLDGSTRNAQPRMAHHAY
eukprot:scaffold704_cov347-Prasinococcus_capsulatus_cf.AAC.17